MRKICFLFLILLTALNIFSKENNFELGKKYFKHPFYFNAKFELSGNTLSLLDNIFKFERRDESIIHNDTQRSVFGTVYSQFAKLDLDIRKYFNFKTKYSCFEKIYFSN